MRNAVREWDTLKGRLAGKHAFLFLDFDGTLAPIASSPGKAALPRQMRALLARLAAAPRCSVAIISGRSLADIKKKVSLSGIIYVGNHGLELEAPGMRSESPIPPSYRALIREIRRKLEKAIVSLPGVSIEDKDLTISIHYRQATVLAQRMLRKEVVSVMRPYVRAGKVKLGLGKKVYEVRPTKGWHKGKVVKWLLARQHFLLRQQPIIAIYIGDDVTDEDAFMALKDDGITVFVGRSSTTCAAFTVRDTDDVRRFLEHILVTRGV